MQTKVKINNSNYKEKYIKEFIIFIYFQLFINFYNFINLQKQLPWFINFFYLALEDHEPSPYKSQPLLL